MTCALINAECYFAAFFGAGNGNLSKIERAEGEIVTVLFFSTEHHATKAYWGSGV
jgi:hypothetical protein